MPYDPTAYTDGVLNDVTGQKLTKGEVGIQTAQATADAAVSGLAGKVSINAPTTDPNATITNTALPLLVGTPVVGNQIVCTDGSWTAPSAFTLKRQWLRNDVAILGATDSVYQIVSADVGQALKCSVTATTSTAAATATTATITPTAASTTSIPAAITDEFNAALTGQWTAGGTGTSVDTTSGLLRIAPVQGGSGIYTTTAQNFTGKQFTAGPIVPIGAPLSADFQMEVGVDGANYVRMVVTNYSGARRLEIEVYKLGVLVGSTLLTAFDANTMKHWSIYESGGTTYCATSPDGTTWTTRRSFATADGPAITATYMVFRSYNYDAATYPPGGNVSTIDRVYAAAFTAGSAGGGGTTGTKATLRGVGGAGYNQTYTIMISDADARARISRKPEIRVMNNTPWTSIPATKGGGLGFPARTSQTVGANNYAMSAAEIDHVRKYSAAYEGRNFVSGNHLISGTATTDEVMQWAAHKWGWDEDMVRAQCITETNWNQDLAGDGSASRNMYMSYGIAQRRVNSNGETAPFYNGSAFLARDSTGVSVDNLCAALRYYYDGEADAVGLTRSQPACKGDLWGSVGRWFCGWSNLSNAAGYVADVKNHLANRTWETNAFINNNGGARTFNGPMSQA